MVIVEKDSENGEKTVLISIQRKYIGKHLQLQATEIELIFTRKSGSAEVCLQQNSISLFRNSWSCQTHLSVVV